MFTFSNKDILEELIKAKKRGVKLSIIIEKNTKRGASKKTIEILKKENIKTKFNIGYELLHHKYLIADNKNLIFAM